MAIPREIQHLRQLAAHIDDYFAMMDYQGVVRSDELFKFLYRQPDFREWCTSYKQFCRFIHTNHDRGLLKQFVKNYHADTDGYYYKWYFYPTQRPYRHSVSEAAGLSHDGANDFLKRGKTFDTSNGVAVRSGQEQHIMNRLLSHSHLEVWYERLLTAGGQDRYPDFTIRNKNTDTVFYWEHFGLTRNEDYADAMAEKIAWYRRIGIDSIERGGRFICTVFVDEQHFAKLVDDLISEMDRIVVPIGFLRYE